MCLFLNIRNDYYDFWFKSEIKDVFSTDSGNQIVKQIAINIIKKQKKKATRLFLYCSQNIQTGYRIRKDYKKLIM